MRDTAPAFTALLVDWRGTLALPLTPRRWVDTALQELRRPPGDADTVLARLEAADAHRLLLTPGMDADPALHRDLYHRVLARAGIDPELAAALYRIESDPAHDLFAADAPAFLARARGAGVRTVVVSDVHVDIRPRFAAAGLADHVDAFALSFEAGAEKPDPRLFEAALDKAGAHPAQALMVGDRPTHDGGAADLGIATLLLPPLRTAQDRRLHLAEALLHTPAPRG
ncbi:HAD family hydrolase [Nocardiopsis suaedae]|uniref:HAD family hydrolase n=1 Tax=Nocardiopsis suaedae TaxID=3018444 RepID=A0ABT4TQ08_9ACTN|nr:HAD family hydrolase [Nocardiopsis suaedae]MDA2806774.1 HAD family hydrolase [Nocardiopsis suaedae]